MPKLQIDITKSDKERTEEKKPKIHLAADKSLNKKQKGALMAALAGIILFPVALFKFFRKRKQKKRMESEA